MFINKRIEKYYYLYRELLTFSGMSWWLIDLEDDPNIFYCNEHMCETFNLDKKLVSHSVALTCPIAGDYNQNIAIKNSQNAQEIFDEYELLKNGFIGEYCNRFPYYNVKTNTTAYYTSRAKAIVTDKNDNACVLFGMIEHERFTEKLYVQATTDGLTGLKNRREFDNHLNFLINLARRESRYISLIMCDVDHFKEYNDLMGHYEGDECLKKIAQSIFTQCQRKSERAFRYGGEEFAIISYGDRESARELAERIRINVLKEAIPHPCDKQNMVTISIGFISLIPSADTSFKDIVELADSALYKAKKDGRNRCVNSLP